MVGVRFYGRMGNVLYQAATCAAYALKHGLDFSFPNKTNSDYWNPLYLQHLANPNWVQGKEDVLIEEQGHQYNELPFDEAWGDKQIVLNGYFQSQKYFQDYRNEIIYLFGYPYEKKEGVVSCHVRRGDYLQLKEKHPYYGKEWYEEAMAMFPGKMFKFFSDDLQWCKDTFGHRRDCVFSTNTNEVQDMVEASSCEHQISSSSTFSWWIAWLNRNPDKKVIIPKLWFVEGFGGLNTDDIVPPEWIKL